METDITPEKETDTDSPDVAGCPAPICSVLKGQVVRKADGRRYVAARDHQLPEGARILQGRPHEEGTEAAGFDYLCGSDWCRCSQ